MKTTFHFFSVLCFALIPLAQVFAEQPLLTPRALSGSVDNSDRLISMTIITQEKDIRRCIGCDLGDVLERAGVQIQRFQGEAQSLVNINSSYVNLRGLSAGHTLLLVDGIRQENSIHSEPLWNLIPVHHIDRIEIVKGPQSAHPYYQGDSSIGGVVHIFTRKATCSEKTLCVDGGTHLSKSPGLESMFYMNVNIRMDQGGVRVGVQGDQNADEETTGEYKERSATVHFDHTTQNGKWITEGNSAFYNNYDRGAPLPTLTPTLTPTSVPTSVSTSTPTSVPTSTPTSVPTSIPTEDLPSLTALPILEKGRFNMVNMGTTYYMSPALLFKFLMGYNRETRLYRNPDNSLRGHTNRRISIKLLGEYQFNFKDEGDYYTLTVGAQHLTGETANPFGALYNKKQSSNALFTSIKRNLAPFTYQTSLRLDSLSGDIKEYVLTWDGSVSYQKLIPLDSHDLILKGGVGAVVRASDSDKEYIQSLREAQANKELSNSVILYNEGFELGTEESITYEAGIRLQNDTYFLDITGFQTALKDPTILSINGGSSASDLPIPVQFVKSNITGVDIQAQVHEEPWTGTVRYLHTHVKQNSVETGRPRLLKYLGSLRLDYSANPKLTIGTEVVYKQKYRDAISGGQFKVMDIYSFYDVNNWLRIGAVLRNATDEQYDVHQLTKGPDRALWLTLEAKDF